MIEQLHHGVCFYPEHWPSKTYTDDIKRIADAGLTYVRIGEGAWWYFQPTENEYRFDLFDDVITQCEKSGLKIIFGTPTYAGPSWIGQKYPEVYRWNFDRLPMKHGSRRNYNYTSAAILDLTDKIVTALAAHYAKTRSIIAWQIDNEFNCHMDVSYAPSDTVAFRVWLRNKYRTLDDLNAAWGTRFWSQVYSDWDAIDLPHPSATYLNPTALLDESRFISDTVVEYAARQIHILTKINRQRSFTHNGLFNNVDGVKLTDQLDFFSHDNYPLFHTDWRRATSSLIAARSLSMPFAVMEQQAGPGGQMSYLLRSPRPGQIRLFAHSAYIHGAKMLGYFCWRTCPFGSEQHWHGILDCDGRDNDRLKQVERVGAELKALPPDFFDSTPEKAVAVLRDFDNEINDRRINTYINAGWEPGLWCEAVLSAHINIDQVWPGSSWAGYKVLIAPHLKMVDQQMSAQYEAFVNRGGLLILGAQSGTQNRHAHTVQQTPPGLLRRLTGIEVADFTTLADGETRTFAFDDDSTCDGVGFVEKLRTRGADIIARWTTDDPLLAGAPAVTANTVGRGTVVYIGAHLSGASITILLPRLLDLCNLSVDPSVNPNIEIINRRSKRARYVCVINHSAEPQFVENLPTGCDLIGDRDIVDGELKLQPFDMAIIEKQQPSDSPTP